MEVKSLSTQDLAQMSDETLYKVSKSIKNQIAYAIRQKIEEDSIKRLQVDHCYIMREINMRRETAALRKHRNNK